MQEIHLGDDMKHFYDLNVRAAVVPIVMDSFKLSIDKGLVTWCGIFFPPGCHAMVRGRVLFQAHQILPRDPDKWCQGNAGWWGGDLYLPVDASPLEIRVEAYAVGTTYSHIITLGLELMPFEMVPQWERLVYLNEELLKAIGVVLPPLEVEEEEE